MNGEERRFFNKVYADIAKNIGDVESKIIKIETTMKERWDAHADRSSCIDKKIDKIFEKLDRLPCAERKWMGAANTRYEAR